jgi:hypothetical protein
MIPEPFKQSINETLITDKYYNYNLIDLFVANQTIIKISNYYENDKYYLFIKRTNDFLIFKELKIKTIEVKNIQRQPDGQAVHYLAEITNEYVNENKIKKFKEQTLRNIMMDYFRYPMFINYFEEENENCPFYQFNQEISYRRYIKQ